MSTTAAVLKNVALDERLRRIRRRVDWSMFIGVGIALAATIAGIAVTGVKATYFFQPAGALIVIGGSIGVLILTTPRHSLLHTARRVTSLAWTLESRRAALLEEIMTFAKPARTGGLVSIEPMIGQASNPFLKDALLLMLDVQQRWELHSALENKVRLLERQGETDAKVLEVAGGFAPTIGVLGTVVGLIDVLRQFSSVQSVASGVGTAFVSTIYGLGLANLILLPAAHRIRAHVADAFETNEMIMEGVMCIFDNMHPALVRERLGSFLREGERR